MECSRSQNITHSNLVILLLLTLVVYSNIVEATNVIVVTTPQNNQNTTATIVRNIYHRSWMCIILDISTVTGICNHLVSHIEIQQTRCPQLFEIIITTGPPSEGVCCTAIAHSGSVGLGRNALRKRAPHKTHCFAPNSATLAIWSEFSDRRRWNI